MSKFLNEIKQAETNQFQEELAKTYFSTASSKEKYSSQSRPAAINHKNGRDKNTLLLIIFSTLLAATAAVFFVFNRLTINVKITPASDAVNGELNSDIVKHVIFYENAGKESSWGGRITALSNEIASRKAVLGIDLVQPVNFREKTLCFTAKGKGGGEEFRVALQDADNNICYSKISAVEGGWRKFILDGRTARDFIDAQKVTHINFEVNPAEKNLSSPSAIYLKDIRFAKQEGGS